MSEGVNQGPCTPTTKHTYQSERHVLHGVCVARTDDCVEETPKQRGHQKLKDAH